MAGVKEQARFRLSLKGLKILSVKDSEFEKRLIQSKIKRSIATLNNDAYQGRGRSAEAYLEPSRPSTMELFCENS